MNKVVLCPYYDITSHEITPAAELIRRFAPQEWSARNRRGHRVSFGIHLENWKSDFMNFCVILDEEMDDFDGNEIDLSIC